MTGWEALYSRIVPWATPLLIGTLLAAGAALWLLLFRLGRSLGDVPDAKFTYTPDDVHAMFSAYGATGRRRYVRNAVTLDLLFPCIYASFLTLVLVRLTSQLTSPPAVLRLLSFTPLLAGICDLLENPCLVMLAWVYPLRRDWLARVASSFTRLKWILVAASALLVIFALFARALSIVV